MNGKNKTGQTFRFPILIAIICLVAAFALAGCASQQAQSPSASSGNAATASKAVSGGVLVGWEADSAEMKSLMNFVEASVDENSKGYIPPEDRIAVFDFDGTLIGERFPTYFNDWLYIQHALYDENFEAPAELKEFAERWEGKVLNHEAFEDFDAMERKLGPKLYEGMTLEDYQNLVRKFRETPVWGFDGMTYRQALFDPMTSVVEYLSDNGYTIYVNSGTYRDAVRVMMEGTLDKWIPVENVIGTDLLYKAEDQEDKSGIDYTMTPDEDLVVAGELFVKNLKTNKVLAMEREIGKHPVLAFGNSSGDFAMANYALQNNEYSGEAYMLLCDDIELDYGDEKVAGEFKEKCEAAGYHTISMCDDWKTIYGEDVKKAKTEEAEQAKAA